MLNIYPNSSKMLAKWTTQYWFYKFRRFTSAYLLRSYREMYPAVQTKLEEAKNN